MTGGVPRVVVAAPASGHGKTTVATGLMAAFAARGLRVSPHKVGPDYIDPGYHALASGRPGRNLDPFLVGEERVAPLFAHGAAGADLAIVEGVMGLFDGASGRGEFASTAHVARLLGAPVLLVVDARAQGRSVAALVHGFATWDPGTRVAGVILNRVGTERHEAIAREALAPLGVPVVGVLGRHDDVGTPSRHLWLVPVAERRAEAVTAVDRLARVVAAGVDMEAVLRIARGAGPLTTPAWSARDAIGEPVTGRPRVALAGGPAFTFAYAETAELLRAAGAEVVTVDPLSDAALPDGVSGLVIGGGFPEVYAEALSANGALRADVARLAREGGAIAAECAGLLYLAESLDGRPMCGVLPARAEMTPRLTLGYREAVAATGSVLAPAGARLRGHEFHRTATSPGHGRPAAWTLDGGRSEGWAAGRVHASYLHLHWAGSPGVARRFAAACAEAAAGAGRRG